jgi:hypothetical protein
MDRCEDSLVSLTQRRKHSASYSYSRSTVCFSSDQPVRRCSMLTGCVWMCSVMLTQRIVLHLKRKQPGRESRRMVVVERHTPRQAGTSGSLVKVV